MFHDIPRAIRERMDHLEKVDAKDREDGTPNSRRMLQVPPDTGRFLCLTAAGAPDGNYIEIGTSAGYSTMWLSLACRELGRTLTTFEVSDFKVDIARETLDLAGIEDIVTLVVGDAREHLGDYRDVSFCFLDAEKTIYEDCYEMVVPNMVSGGVLVADNATSHEEILRPMIDKVLSDSRVDALVVPVGRGELLCRKR